MRFRLFQLRNPDETFVSDQLDTLLPMLGGATEQNTNVRNELEESIKALQFDGEMEALGQACVDDGEWNPQIGDGDEPQPGPSHQPDTPHGLQYIMRKKSERTYAKNAAVDRTYQVKINEEHHGERLEDIRDGLHQIVRPRITRSPWRFSWQ